MNIFNLNAANSLKTIQQNQQPLIPRYCLSNQKATIEKVPIHNLGFLSDKQTTLVNAIKTKHTNLLVAPVGYGKTTFIIKMCLQHKISIIASPTTMLKNQILKSAIKEIEKQNLSTQIESNAHYIKIFTSTQTIYITTYQDLVNHMDFVNQADIICFDECHWFFEYSFADGLTDKLSELLYNLMGRATVVLLSATPNGFEIFPEQTYIEHIVKCEIDQPKLEPENIYLHSSNTVISSIVLCQNFMLAPTEKNKGILVSHKQSCSKTEFGWEELQDGSLGLGYQMCNVAPSILANGLKTVVPNLDFISSQTRENSTILQNTDKANTPFLATSVFSIGINITSQNYSDLMVVSNSISYIRQALGRSRFKLKNLHLIDIKPYTNPNYTTLSFENFNTCLNFQMLKTNTKIWNPFVVVGNWWYLYEQHLYCNLLENVKWLFPHSQINQYKQNNLPTNSKHFNEVNSFYGLGAVPKVKFSKIWNTFTSGNSEKTKIINTCNLVGINFNSLKLQAQIRGHKKLLTVIEINNVVLTQNLLLNLIERNIQNGNIKIQLTK